MSIQQSLLGAVGAVGGAVTDAIVDKKQKEEKKIADEAKAKATQEHLEKINRQRDIKLQDDINTADFNFKFQQNEIDRMDAEEKQYQDSIPQLKKNITNAQNRRSRENTREGGGRATRLAKLDADVDKAQKALERAAQLSEARKFSRQKAVLTMEHWQNKKKGLLDTQELYKKGQ